MNVIELKKQKPTQRWKAFSCIGDQHYTNEVLHDCDEILDQYLDDIVSLGNNPSEEFLRQCVRKAAKQFDALDNEYFFIQSVEREDICEFLYTAAKHAGLDTLEDITEEWQI